MARAIASDAPAASGERRIQRFPFDQPNWNQTTEVTRSGDGAQGVVFLKDGSPFPLVAKASKDPPRETLFATLFYNKMGRKHGVSTPPTRLAGDYERLQIAWQINDKGGWDQDLKQSDVQAFNQTSPNVWVMGLAKGKAFGSKREMGEGFTEAPLGKDRTVMLLEDPEYARKLGFVVACDLFLGNGDRIDVGNLGNWMTDEAGAISLIDNFSSESYQSLTARSQQSWETTFMPDLRPSNYKQKGESVYQIIASMVAQDVKEGLGKSFSSGPEGRKKLFAANFAKGMADGRKAILAKLAPVFGKRSRSMKQSVVSGPGGEEAWAILKLRVRMFRSLS